MNRLRTRLLVLFLAATLVPLAVTLLLSWGLLDLSISSSPAHDLDVTSQALEQTGRALYTTACDALRSDVALHRVRPSAVYARASIAPQEIRDFIDTGDREAFHLTGDKQDNVVYYVREGSSVVEYTRPLGGPDMRQLADQLARNRSRLERADTTNLRRGYSLTLILIAILVWLISVSLVSTVASRVTKPIEMLTAGLGRLAAGELGARVPESEGMDEVARATRAFNQTAAQLSESQQKLVLVTRLSSWQTLARKMAHEVKNSLTPIRLTVEEIVARRSDRDQAFFEQAAQIVVEEVSTLERRVRAFSQFAAEPPVQPGDIDLNTLFEERLALLRTAYPDVVFDARLAPHPATAHADPDLVKGVLTNLLDNAAHAAGSGGVILGRTFVEDGKVGVEIHDSGPGLSAQVKETLFEPAISFKKTGMGLGLSIAKRSALLTGGDLQLVEGELGGAAFRVLLPRAMQNGHA